MLPVKVEGEYDLRATFTRQEGDDVLVGLPVGSHDCTLGLGCWNGSVHGLGKIDGQDADHNPATRRPGKLNNGEQYHILVKVRLNDQAASIKVLLDDEQIIQWEGQESSLASWDRTVIPQKQQFGFLVHDAKVTFHSAELCMVSGKAFWATSAKPAWPALPPGPQNDREVAKWLLTINGGVGVVFESGREEVG